MKSLRYKISENNFKLIKEILLICLALVFGFCFKTFILGQFN